MKKDKKEIVAIFEEFEHRNKAPTTELEFSNLFQLLVAVILSAQATDKGVNLATRSLFQQVKNPADLLKFSLEELMRMIGSIGLFRNKAKYLLATARILDENFGGEVPSTRAALESLPGVGRKTANVILNTFFDEPVIAVDTHVKRVSLRLGLAESENLLQLEQELYDNIPSKYLKNAHHHLILHGRYICKARGFDCSKCFLNKYCDETRK